MKFSDKRENIQISSNDKNVTLISTVMKLLAVESSRLKTKMAKIPRSVNPTAKSQALESLSLENLEVKVLLEKFVSKKSDSKKKTLKPYG